MATRMVLGQITQLGPLHGVKRLGVWFPKKMDGFLSSYYSFQSHWSVESKRKLTKLRFHCFHLKLRHLVGEQRMDQIIPQKHQTYSVQPLHVFLVLKYDFVIPVCKRSEKVFPQVVTQQKKFQVFTECLLSMWVSGMRNLSNVPGATGHRLTNRRTWNMDCTQTAKMNIDAIHSLSFHLKNPFCRYHYLTRMRTR